MKRIKGVLLIILLLVTINVKAEDILYYPELNCDKKEIINSTDEITCTLELSIENKSQDVYKYEGGKVYYKSFTYSFKNFNFVKSQAIIEANGTGAETDKFIYKTEIEVGAGVKSEKFTIATIKANTTKKPSYTDYEIAIVANGKTLSQKIKYHSLDLKELKIDGKDKLTDVNNKKSYISTKKEIEVTGIPLDDTSKVEGLGKLTLKEGKNEFSIVVKNEAMEENTTKTYKLVVEYSGQKSTNNNLRSIKINASSLPDFDKDTTEYIYSSKSSKIKIMAQAEDQESSTVTFTKDGQKASLGTEYVLKEGNTEFIIKVKSEAGELKEYVIKVVYSPTASTDASLKKLNLYNGKTKLDDFKFELYNENKELNTNFDYSTTLDKITIKAVLNDSNAEFKEDYTNKEVELVNGENKFNIVVIAESGDSKTYTLTITKTSKYAQLEKLLFNDKEVLLELDKFEYEYKVRSNVDKLVIKPGLFEGSYYGINGKRAEEETYELDLSEGENDLIINVAQKGLIGSKYNFKIIKLSEAESTINVNTITLKDYDLKLDSNTKEYELKVNDNVDKIEFNEYDKDFITIEGNDKIENNSVITIKIDNPNGVEEYKIKVLKGNQEILIFDKLTVNQFCYIFLGVSFLFFLISCSVAKKRKKQRVEY